MTPPGPVPDDAGPARASSVGEDAPSASPAPGEHRFAGGVAVLFCAATLPRLLLHEMWRDEVWLWLVAIESRTFAELTEALSRSGQGYLFPFLVWFASAFTRSPVALQLLHLGIAGAGAFVFARYAPFPRPVRVLFLLGYLPFYEYAVLSRHYALGALLTWIACAAARSRRPAIPLGLALGLLCQTTVYGLILAAAIVAGFLFERFRRGGDAVAIPWRETLAGGAIGLAGAIAGIVQLVPAAGTSFAPAWRLAWEPRIFERVLQSFWKPMVPMPHPRLHFWNSNLLEAWPLAMAVAGPLVVAGAITLLWPRRAALVTFAVGAAGFGAFAYVKFIGYLRHTGHLWLLLFAALWIGAGFREMTSGRGWRTVALRVLLVVHVAAALVASAVDLARPFSGAPEAARLLREHGLDRLPLAGFRDPPSAPVALALGQPLYSPSRNRFATHPDWGPAQREVSVKVFRCSARGLAGRSGGAVGLVSNRDLPDWPEAPLVARTSPSIERSEEYRLYRLELDRIPPADDAGCGAIAAGGEAPSSSGAPKP